MAGYKSVLTINKLKSSSQLKERYCHDYRTREVPNADKDKFGDNDFILKCEDRYDKEVERKINSLEYYKTHDVRKNAVRAYDINLTFSHNADKEIGFDMEKWKEENVKWLEQTFNTCNKNIYGDNIVSIVCHMDEQTPHIHAIVVPIDDKGKLNASYYTGHRDKYFYMQDTYGKAMEKLGLERGIRHSVQTHDTMRHLYGQVADTIENIEYLSKTPEETEKDFEDRVHEVRTNEHLVFYKQVSDLEREKKQIQDTYKDNVSKDLHIAQLEKDNKRLIKEREELIHEFGSITEIRRSCKIMQDLKNVGTAVENGENTKIKTKYDTTINNIADLVSWNEAYGNRKKSRKEPVHDDSDILN